MAVQLLRSSISLNALYKPIQAVAQEVEHFLRNTRQGMVQYNAMEHFYGKLQELKGETETLSLKRKWLESLELRPTTDLMREFQAGRIIVRDAWDSNRSDLQANPLYNLLFRSGAGRCFLSSAGLYFLQELVREYEQG